MNSSFSGRSLSRAWQLLVAVAALFVFTGALSAQTVVRQINAGGGAVSPFAADSGSSGGNTFSSTATINLSGVTNPAPQAVYQSVRWASSFNYTLTGLTASTSYRVRLHFVELSFPNAGSRKFNVALNGTNVLTNFDIVATAGAMNKALVSEFTTTSTSSGQIVIAFSQGAADNPSIAGIEVYTVASGQSAYGGTNFALGNNTTLQAENYDVGGEGVAYHDVDAGNSGGAYRSDNVDLEATSDTGGGYNVGWMRDGEWLEYTTNTTAGLYNIVVRAASGSAATKSLRVLLDGTLLGTASIPNTGGWQTFQDVTISGVTIPGGTGKVLRLEVVGDDFNVNYLRFATTAQTFPLTVTNGSGGGSYAAGTVVNITANAAPSGQVFAGWTGGTAANFGNAASASTTYTTTSAAQTITATYAAAQTFTLTVNNGSGDGNYVANTTVNIVADAPPSGQVFAGWTGGTAANFGNAAAASTTYKTTSANQTITATYTSAPTYALTVTNGSGGGSYAAGTVVNITANAAPSGQVFSGWTGGTAANFGNASSASTTYTTAASAQTIVANYTSSSGSNLALGKTMTASSTTQSFVAADANDNSTSTYWEGAGFPANLEVNLGANASITQLVVKLDPSTAWGARTQTIAVWGHDQTTTTFTQLLPATVYSFNPSSGNTATISLSTTASAIRLVFSANTGAQSGQAAEFQVIGNWAPNPDLIVTGITWSPTSPNESTAITLSATVKNNGSATAAASQLAFNLNGTAVGSAVSVPSLTAGSSTVVSASIGALPAGSYTPGATADSGNTVIETNDANNAFTNSTAMVVGQTPGPDLQVVGITPSNANPAAGAAVSFTVAVNNRGTTGVAANTTTRVVVGSTTLNQTATPAIAAGATVNVSIPGTWTATNGNSVVTATADAANAISETNESNNSFSGVILAGRGAAMPYMRYESEDATLGGGAQLRTDYTFNYQQIAAEASNQAYAALPGTGSYVEWTVASGGGGAGVNMRFTMPDRSDGMGNTGSVDCYVNGVKVQTINLSSYWSWQYFATGSDQPQDAPIGSSGVATFKFDEVHWKLATALVPGDKIRIQSSGAGGFEYGVDFLEIEQVPTAISQPANSLSVTAYGATADDATDDLAAFNACVSAAIAQGKSVYIPAGKFNLSSMWIIGSVGSPAGNLTITGAGIWYTNIQFTNPNQSGGGISFRMAATAKLDFGNMYLNSSLRTRYNQQAIYKCFMDNFGVNSRVHDFWEEHFECGFWVADYAHTPVQVADGLLIENGRVRNNLADGINFCQGTKNSTVQNCSVRNNGDDGLAVWPDSTNGAPMGVNNTFSHNTIENNWRAGGIAFFGGSGHKAQFNYIKDCFMGSGIRMNTVFPGYHFENNTGILFSDTTIINCGTSQDVYNGERGAIDLEASNTSIKNVTLSDIDIFDSQRDAIQVGYSGGFSGVVFNRIYIDGTGKDATTTSRFAAAHGGAAFFSYTNNGAITFNTLTYTDVENNPPLIVPSGFTLTVNP